ncbi:uncharacterized protein Z520_05008 [Fonsecaea multimorphosa CBS 102226]|uniref:Fe2OG dioxygenase domain-containing protein n=1 Tax=Fonsecaea multimorphosa CBS 102226 TaxID=1442371 RepID=A0A0D2K0Y3_9EURO|nr:uncharacterized protein Z520_05008 [Fonsecaea multimorphosa CBS 102226]KIX99432.1 hypothetical protein Z520_05008 [Fonsecaea multimorphosa CBS 102226]OAL25759.1 hypothetical protein AYO22_04748 [Fonsecaea multimorphosa]
MTPSNGTDPLPPFPDSIPTIPIAKISHHLLLAQDKEEISKTLKACQTDGFFYLDLTTTESGRHLIEMSAECLALAKRAFALPQEEKTAFANEKGTSIFGYKPMGSVKKTDLSAVPDSTEFFNIAKDHIHGITEPRSYPRQIIEGNPILADFTTSAHACGMVVLQTLANALGVDSDLFTSICNFKHPSGDHVRLTRTVPVPADDSRRRIGLSSHTDFGAVTILFNWLGGLQIQSRAKETEGDWLYVKPLAGHAIINLGDCMVKFTNGAVKSAKHRVVPSPGQQAAVDRYSIVYFVRPCDDVLMTPLRGFEADEVVKVAGKFGDDRLYTAGEWNHARLTQMGA